jgi:hypothetical protein
MDAHCNADANRDLDANEHSNLVERSVFRAAFGSLLSIE